TACHTRFEPFLNYRAPTSLRLANAPKPGARRCLSPHPPGTQPPTRNTGLSSNLPCLKSALWLKHLELSPALDADREQPLCPTDRYWLWIPAVQDDRDNSWSSRDSLSRHPSWLRVLIGKRFGLQPK